jgi:hypothetical protein
MKCKLVALALLILAISSCNDNELDINAPWKEIPVVYAVINSASDTQIFRIQKVYQNALGQTTNEVAQIADSLTLKNIEVSLENLNTEVKTPLSRIASIKENGFFSDKDSSYWMCVIPKHTSQSRPANYKLIIKSNNTGKTYTGVTNIVTPVNITRAQTPINLITTSTSNTLPITVSGGGMNTAQYVVSVRITYTEAPKTDPSNTVSKTIEHNIANRTLPTTSSNITFLLGFEKAAVFTSINAQVKYNPEVVRTFTKFEYVLTCANKAYTEMVEVNSPSGSVVGKSQDYSNITDGIGIFGSRTVTAVEQMINTASEELVNKTLNPTE